MKTSEAREVLGLQDSCTPEDVDEAYKRLVKKCHPDIGGTAYLFRLVSEARDVLKSGETQNTQSGQRENAGNAPPRAQQQAKARQQKRREPTWEELISDPNFVCPAKEFLLIVAGCPQSVRFKGYNVKIMPNNLYSHFIRAQIPVTLELHTWKNWFRRIFCKPEIIKKEFLFKNKYPNNKDFGLTVSTRINPDEDRYYRIRIKVLGEVFTLSGLSKNFRQAMVLKNNARVRGVNLKSEVYFEEVD